ncbi:MAG TPA: MFS transporter, partial [Isosphaeraceae bacterium]|nr:MFS transporter [Isosphaeraceae bacterium]
IFWGLPAVVLGVVVFIWLTDRPSQARWLEPDEREALESALKAEKAASRQQHGHMGVLEALRHRKVIFLAMAYFFVVTGNYGVELFMPSIIQDWYKLKLEDISLLVIIPPIGSLVGQLLVGWSSDRFQERRLHTCLPILMGALALGGVVLSRGHLWLTVALFTITMTGLKAYLPAFWSLPSLFLTEAAAAGSIGLINSVGNLGGALGPAVLGVVKKVTQSYERGILFLAVSMSISAIILLTLGLGRRETAKSANFQEIEEEAIPEPM